MSFTRPEFLWLTLLALPEFLLALSRARRLGVSIEYLTGPRRRGRAASIFSAVSFCGALAVALFVASTAVALAGPSWGRTGRAAERSGLELSFVLDVSRSMEVRDGSPTRLDSAKGIIRSLLRSLPSTSVADRAVSFSLVAAKGDAVLLVPMTEDGETIDVALDYTGPDTLTAAGTNLERGIAEGLASFPSVGSGSRILVLFSDGGELAGRAREAAEGAKSAKARLIVVGLGGGEAAIVPGLAGPALDAKGQPARSSLDAPFLRSLAAAAEGRYIDGSDPSVIGTLAAEIAGARAGGARIEYEAVDRTGLFAALSLVFLLGAILADLFAPRGGQP
jgi:Ca-activated chloride channel family protein